MGELDVDAMLARVSARQLARWRAFERLEPWGGVQQDLRAIATALLILNAWRDKGARAVKIFDLFPHLKKDCKPGGKRAQLLRDNRRLGVQIAAMAAQLAGAFERQEPRVSTTEQLGQQRRGQGSGVRGR